MYFDDEPERSLAKPPLPVAVPKFVSLTCPDCPAVVVGLGDDHAADLLAIHQEAACQGGGERK